VFHTTLLRTYKEKAQMLLYRQLFRRSDLLIYVSENQRDRWRDWGLRAAAERRTKRDRRRLLLDREPSGEHEHCAPASADRADYVIGLCSGLRPEKAHGDLLQALARCAAAA
jgi:hypothetical protein